MIWIIGGTNESITLAKKIKGNANYIITIATEDGKEFFDDDNIIIGRMNKNSMINFCKEKNITAIADISHPYAEEVSKNAKYVSSILNIQYHRYIRKESCNDKDKTFRFKNISDLCNFLQTLKGTCFFTTGSKNIPDFQKVKGSNRFIYRILPSPFGIDICRNCGVEIKNIVAMLGPFNIDLNKAMFKNFNANYVVLKDSGKIGGTPEKIIACEELSIIPLILERPNDTGENDIEKIANILIKLS